MKEQIAQLLKLLNKGVEHLPDTINVVVQQYAMRKWVSAGGLFILAVIIALGGCYCLRHGLHLPKKPARPETKYHYAEPESLTNEATTWLCVSAVSLIFAFLLLAIALSCVADAVSPIYSMIKDFR